MNRVKCRYFAANFGSIFFNLCLNFALNESFHLEGVKNRRTTGGCLDNCAGGRILVVRNLTSDPLSSGGEKDESGCSDSETGTGFAEAKLSEILPPLAFLRSSV
jgi:hypothetical protein